MMLGMDDVRENGHLTAKQYFAMAECGIFSPDERVELLDGLIVAMTPPTPWHSAGISRIHAALVRALGPAPYIRTQDCFRVDDQCVPEPDLAIVPGSFEDYVYEHPSRAHLVVEVAYTSLTQDRITKSAIYARAGVPCYWLVNLRELCVEVFQRPNRDRSEYMSCRRCTGPQICPIDAFPESRIEAAELLPPPGVVLPGKQG